VVRLKADRQQAGVRAEWDVRDEHLDVRRLLLDYRPAGREEWLPLAVKQKATGQHAWTPAADGPAEIRLRVRDRAGNTAEATVSVPGAKPK
jgi:hypothetical protein